MKNLLLLHGALGSEDQIKPLIELLSNDFNCKTFSFKGHGHQRKESFTIDSLAKQTAISSMVFPGILTPFLLIPWVVMWP